MNVSSALSYSDDDDSDAPPRDSAPIPPHRRGLKLAKD